MSLVLEIRHILVHGKGRADLWRFDEELGVVQLHVRPDDIGGTLHQSRISHHATKQRRVELHVVTAVQRTRALVYEPGGRPASIAPPAHTALQRKLSVCVI